jgi:hypothetical protein
VSVRGSGSNIVISGNHFWDLRRGFLGRPDWHSECIRPHPGANPRWTITNNIDGVNTYPGQGSKQYDPDTKTSFLIAFADRLDAPTVRGNVDNDSRGRWNGVDIYNPGGRSYDPGPWEYQPPVKCSIAVNGGAAATAVREVALALAAGDSGSGMGAAPRFPLKQGGLMQFSDDGLAWSEVRPFARTATWRLTGEPGAKQVFARFRDADGNWSAPVSAAIRLIGR